MSNNRGHQVIKSREDLAYLITGDIVTAAFQYKPVWKNRCEPKACIYQELPDGKIEVIMSETCGNNPFITTYCASPNKVDINSGSIIFNEDESSIKSYIPRDAEYKRLNDILEKSEIKNMKTN